jgi:hypothetical protein
MICFITKESWYITYSLLILHIWINILNKTNDDNSLNPEGVQSRGPEITLVEWMKEHHP